MHLSREKLDLNQLMAEVHNPRAGAVVIFSGEARNHNDGKSVAYLEFEAYDSMAEKIIAAILEDARNKWELEYAHCMHRIGRVEITESCVVVLTASAHRAAAYEANRYIIDRLKNEAPIWKKEWYSDGRKLWLEQQAQGGVRAGVQTEP